MLTAYLISLVKLSLLLPLGQSVIYSQPCPRRLPDLSFSVNMTTRGPDPPHQDQNTKMAPKLELTAFFEGTEGDYRGRKFSDILEWSDSELEASHDYIQTLFPLPEASLVNWSATIIDRKVFDAFRAQPELREKLRAALTRILSFYGFQWLENADHKKVRQTAPKSDESLAPLSSD